MSTNPFALQDHIDFLFAPLAQNGSAHHAIAKEEQSSSIKTELQNLLGLAERQREQHSAKLVKVLHQPTYREEYITLNTGEQVQVPIVILVPKRQPPFSFPWPWRWN